MSSDQKIKFHIDEFRFIDELFQIEILLLEAQSFLSKKRVQLQKQQKGSSHDDPDLRGNHIKSTAYAPTTQAKQLKPDPIGPNGVQNDMGFEIQITDESLACETSKDSIYECEECQRYFPSQRSLSLHRTKQHKPMVGKVKKRMHK